MITHTHMQSTENARFDFVIANESVFFVIEVDEAKCTNYCGEIASANEGRSGVHHGRDTLHDT